MTGPVFLPQPADTAFALRLVTDLEVTAGDAECWSEVEIQRAENWLGTVHLAKTLPGIRVPPMPAFLTRYQRKDAA